jgi:ABC-type xylose transport system substrate-binding protein
LKFAIETWQKKSFENDPYRKVARDRIIENEDFKTYINLYNQKCGSK